MPNARIFEAVEHQPERRAVGPHALGPDGFHILKRCVPGISVIGVSNTALVSSVAATNATYSGKRMTIIPRISMVWLKNRQPATAFSIIGSAPYFDIAELVTTVRMMTRNISTMGLRGGGRDPARQTLRGRFYNQRRRTALATGGCCVDDRKVSKGIHQFTTSRKKLTGAISGSDSLEEAADRPARQWRRSPSEPRKWTVARQRRTGSCS